MRRTDLRAREDGEGENAWIEREILTCDETAIGKRKEKGGKKEEKDGGRRKEFSKYVLIASINPSLVYAKHLICGVHTARLSTPDIAYERASSGSGNETRVGSC